jgi:3-hydroxyacyl-[acyl-carrier-protein] dehydratase
MRFTLVDRITSLEPGSSVTAVKSLSQAEEYLMDHFPGFPVIPGVLMLESLVQASAWLMRATENFQYSQILLKEAKALKFSNLVTPGKILEITSKVHERTEREWVFKGSGTVDGGSAVSVRFTLEQFNLRENNPALEHSDKMCVAALKKLFEQLWGPQINVRSTAGA